MSVRLGLTLRTPHAGLTARHVEPLIGHLALGQVKPSDITRVLLHKEQLGRSASTRRNACAAVRSAFDDAAIFIPAIQHRLISRSHIVLM